MVRRFFISVILMLPVTLFAGKYTPQMYEQAIAPDTVVKTVDHTVVVHDTVVVKETVVVRDTVNVATPVDTVAPVATVASVTAEATVAAATATTENVYRDESGNALKLQYHVVVGSFSDKLNAQNFLDQIMQKGEGSPSLATSPDGKVRVFYYSTANEADARKVLSQIKEEYPAAWLLNLNK